MSIFVSIAAYRDPQLEATIEGCLAAAADPDDVRIGVCWQHGPEETLAMAGDPRLRVLDVDHRASRGVCWARSEIMGLWAGEDWYLQLDAHHRFAPGWDRRLVAMAAETGSDRPILTTYAPGYRLPLDGPLDERPWQINFGRWTPEGFPLFFPGGLWHWPKVPAPVPARFASGNFLFAPGRFVRDVPYDPLLYFQGEEITMTVRAYTAGYDLFHPHEALVWHDYSRNRPHTHWSDHGRGGEVATPWWEREEVSNRRVRELLVEAPVGGLGLGTVRSMGDYQAYAGLDFARCRADEYTLHDLPPPNPPVEAGWAERPRRWRLSIRLSRSRLGRRAFLRADQWDVAVLDVPGTEIDAVSLTGAGLADVLAGEAPTVELERVFSSASTPVRWAVTAFDAEGEELASVDGLVDGRKRGGPDEHGCHIVDRLDRSGR